MKRDGKVALRTQQMGPVKPGDIAQWRVEFVPETEAKPVICPICRGRGLVKHDFYDQIPPLDYGVFDVKLGARAERPEPVECRTCSAGIVWPPQ